MATYTLLDTLPPQFFGITNGKAVPLSGGTLESYAAGTETPQNVYSDSSGTVLGTSVGLDSRGELMTVKNIWLKVGDSYKFRLKDSAGVEVWTVDDIDTDQGIRTFTDQITINVPSAKAPFVLNALAQGQLVTGLNADQVDGAHVGTSNGNVVLRENLSSAAQLATESAQGVAELATQAEVDAETDDARIVTALKLATYANLEKNSTKSFVEDGYIIHPSGLILQWGEETSAGTITLPTSYPNANLGVVATSNKGDRRIVFVTAKTTTNFTSTIWDTSSETTQNGSGFFWFSWGH